MRILLLGPECPVIEEHLKGGGHSVNRVEDAFDINYLEANGIEFGISYRFKKIIAQREISWFGSKLVNLHISLLPWNRGSDPNLWSYLEETPRGVSIHILDSGIDTGDIILQQAVDIDLANDTLSTSYEKLSRAIEALFVDNSKAILQGALPVKRQAAGGSFHLSRDKQPYLPLLELRGWNTPVRELLGRAIR